MYARVADHCPLPAVVAAFPIVGPNSASATRKFSILQAVAARKIFLTDTVRQLGLVFSVFMIFPDCDQVPYFHNLTEAV